MTLNRPVYLIGFMGCGKSTLGRAVSALSGLPFIDLDAEAEKRTGASIPETFRSGKQELFRRAEHEALRSLSKTPAIIACGGGTPCRDENMELMLSTGTVIWITADRGRIIRRLMEAPAAQRPLLSDVHSDAEALGDRVDELMSARAEAYGRAHERFDGTYLDNEQEITQTVSRFIELLKPLTTNP